MADTASQSWLLAELQYEMLMSALPIHVWKVLACEAAWRCEQLSGFTS